MSTLPSMKSSAVSSAVGMFSLLPAPLKRARALSCAFFASSSPWTMLVSSKARISFARLSSLPSHFALSSI